MEGFGLEVPADAQAALARAARSFVKFAENRKEHMFEHFLPNLTKCFHVLRLLHCLEMEVRAHSTPLLVTSKIILMFGFFVRTKLQIGIVWNEFGSCDFSSVANIFAELQLHLGFRFCFSSVSCCSSCF